MATPRRARCKARTAIVLVLKEPAVMRHYIFRLTLLAAMVASSAVCGGWKWGDLFVH